MKFNNFDFLVSQNFSENAFVVEIEKKYEQLERDLEPCASIIYWDVSNILKGLDIKCFRSMKKVYSENIGQ